MVTWLDGMARGTHDIIAHLRLHIPLLDALNDRPLMYAGFDVRFQSGQRC